MTAIDDDETGVLGSTRLYIFPTCDKDRLSKDGASVIEAPVDVDEAPEISRCNGELLGAFDRDLVTKAVDVKVAGVDVAAALLAAKDEVDGIPTLFGVNGCAVESAKRISGTKSMRRCERESFRANGLLLVRAAPPLADADDLIAELRGELARSLFEAPCIRAACSVLAISNLLRICIEAIDTYCCMSFSDWISFLR